MAKPTIVTAVTPDYLNLLRATLPTWRMKLDGKLVVFWDGFESDKDLQFVGEYFDSWEMFHWLRNSALEQRERMLSSFIYGAEYIKTEHFIKVDADTYFTDTQPIFDDSDYKFDIVSHRWGYTKPGWWIDILEGREPDMEKKKVKHSRVQSIVCLHRTKFVQAVAKRYRKRLPIPSHDTLLWWIANKEGTWRAKNMKKLGVCHGKKVSAIPTQDVVRLDGLKDEQIWKFVEESLILDWKWKRVETDRGHKFLDMYSSITGTPITGKQEGTPVVLNNGGYYGKVKALRDINSRREAPGDY